MSPLSDSADLGSSGTATVTVAAAPVISSVRPTAGPTAGGQTVMITGTGLTGATKVTFASVAATHVTVVSDTELTVTTPAHASGSVNVRVTTSGGISAASTTDYYTYDAVPTVAAVTPAIGPQGTVVTISGGP